MSFFDNIILNSIFIIVPIGFYFLISLHNKDINRKNNKLLIDLACLTSIYLIFRYSMSIPDFKNLLFINIPLIIVVIYKRKYTYILLSFLIVLFYNKIFGFDLYFLVVEYMIYFIVFYLLKCKDKSSEFIISLFIFIKGIVLTIEFMNYFSFDNYIVFFYQLSNLVLFYLLSIILIYGITKSEELVNFNNILKELEKEKVLKNSLFKITHEIKNPIAVCKGYLSMISVDDNTTLRYLSIIKSEIDRTLDIMDNFSEYTKIKINKEEMDFCYLIEDVVKSMGVLFDEKGIDVRYNGPDELYLEGDYNRLKQVIVNVLKNACEAISNKGIIFIRLFDNKDNLVVKIIDNGCGISDEDLSKISMLFHSSKEKGCGIGVPLSKEIVNLHGGSINYFSKIDKGTTVTIKIPKK